MKRIFIIVLVLSLSLSPSSFAVSSAPTSPAPHVAPQATAFPKRINHEIWGIPWGISIDEFLSLAREKTGVDFVLGPPLSESNINYRSTKKQSITIMGYPIQYIDVTFSKENGNYEFLYADYDLGDFATDANSVSTLYVNLFNALFEKYGPPTWIAIEPFPKNELVPTGILPSGFPIISDQIDQTELAQFLKEFKELDYEINAEFSNISLNLSRWIFLPNHGEYFLSIGAVYYHEDAYIPFTWRGNDTPVLPSSTIRLDF